MMNFGFGMGELFTIFVVAILSLAFPLAVIVLLVKIHKRLKNIEERLKDK